MRNSATKIMGNQLSTSRDLKTETEKTAICEHHGEFLQKVRMVMGKEFKTNCPECSEEKAEKERRAEHHANMEKRSSRIRRLLGESGIPKRFALRSFGNYKTTNTDQEKALKVSRYFAVNFDKFLETGASLIFCGKPGTGKTHLAAAIANSVCEQGRSVVFMSVLKATRMVKDTWKKGSESSENQVYKGLIDPDLLILDEVGVQFGSDSEKLILFEILNGRYENVRPTIVISNLLPDEITQYLGERVVDRLQEGGGSTVVFGWESYRPKVLGDELLPKANVSPVNWEK